MSSAAGHECWCGTVNFSAEAVQSWNLIWVLSEALLRVSRALPPTAAPWTPNTSAQVFVPFVPGHGISYQPTSHCSGDCVEADDIDRSDVISEDWYPVDKKRRARWKPFFTEECVQSDNSFISLNTEFEDEDADFAAVGGSSVDSPREQSDVIVKRKWEKKVKKKACEAQKHDVGSGRGSGGFIAGGGGGEIVGGSAVGPCLNSLSAFSSCVHRAQPAEDAAAVSGGLDGLLREGFHSRSGDCSADGLEDDDASRGLDVGSEFMNLGSDDAEASARDAPCKGVGHADLTEEPPSDNQGAEDEQQEGDDRARSPAAVAFGSLCDLSDIHAVRAAMEPFLRALGYANDNAVKSFLEAVKPRIKGEEHLVQLHNWAHEAAHLARLKLRGSESFGTVSAVQPVISFSAQVPGVVDRPMSRRKMRRNKSAAARACDDAFASRSGNHMSLISDDLKRLMTVDELRKLAQSISDAAVEDSDHLDAEHDC
jgi:hypothetical protein